MHGTRDERTRQRSLLAVLSFYGLTAAWLALVFMLGCTLPNLPLGSFADYRSNANNSSTTTTTTTSNNNNNSSTSQCVYIGSVTDNCNSRQALAQICNDGFGTCATGSGACSGHNGVCRTANSNELAP